MKHRALHPGEELPQFESQILKQLLEPRPHLLKMARLGALPSVQSQTESEFVAASLYARLYIVYPHPSNYFVIGFANCFFITFGRYFVIQVATQERDFEVAKVSQVRS